MRQWFWVFLILCSGTTLLQGQVNPNANRRAPLDRTPVVDTLADSLQVIEEVDTVALQYFYQNDPFVFYPITDTSLYPELNQYDPSRRSNWMYAHLGNLGSPARPLIWKPERQTGFDLGLHLYDLYTIQRTALRSYIVGKPLSDLSFSQGATQEQSYLRTLFSRNFSRGIHLDVDFTRHNQNGIYINQALRGSYLQSTLWFKHKNGRYQGFLNYLLNHVQAEENGGLPDLSLFGTPRSGNKQIFPVNLSDATSDDRDQTFELKQFLRLNGDSIQRPSWTTDLQANLYYTSRRSSFLNIGIPDEPTYFSPWDQIGRDTISRFVRDRSLGFDAYFWLQHPDTIALHAWRLKAGLEYASHHLIQDTTGTGSQIHVLALVGMLQVPFTHTTTLQANARLFTGTRTGDLELQGQMIQQLAPGQYFRAEAGINRYHASYLESQFWISDTLVWDQDWKALSALYTNISIELPRFDFLVRGSAYRLGNWLYYNRDKQPENGGAIQIWQLEAKKSFHLGILHSYHQIVAQNSNRPEALPLPAWVMRHGIYLESNLFKKHLHFQLGLDGRWQSEYTPPTYFPLTGQFYNQTNWTTSKQPWLEAFFQFEVKSLRGFVKYENLWNLWSEDPYFQHPLYPYFDAGLRLGLRWILRN
ncbi:MAG: putative porin [Saprospiraceae bacterium]